MGCMMRRDWVPAALVGVIAILTVIAFLLYGGLIARQRAIEQCVQAFAYTREQCVFLVQNRVTMLP